jgi:DNA ligase 1
MILRVFTILTVAILLFGVELQKPKVYKGDENISGWVMSEKLDGIRGYWDGKKMFTRQGKEIAAPSEFTVNFPSFELDGELWVGRGKFEETQSAVMDKTPSDRWQMVSYNIFEVPNSEGNFTERLEIARNWFASNPNPNVQIIEQLPCRDAKHLKDFLETIVSLGGEGVVVKNPLTPYHSGRSSQVLKVKKFDDMEGEVTAVNISKKTGKLGSLTLKLANGVVFRLGSGFNAQTAKNSPKIRDFVTFKYFGFTAKGKPRFAVFMRVRRD